MDNKVSVVKVMAEAAGLPLWQYTWRHGFAPQMTAEQLDSLRAVLAADDGRLLQGGTSSPPPLRCVEDWEVEAACAVSWCGWLGAPGVTVKTVEEFFAKACFEADRLLAEMAACRYFLNWFDDTPRDTVRRDLLAELTGARPDEPATVAV